MLTLAWDIDDVLNDCMLAWFMYKWLPEHPQCNITYEQLTENPPHKILQISKDEYLTSLDDFRVSDYLIKITPCQEILMWFKQHGFKARHIALTGVPTSTAHISAEWVIKNFGNWVRTFHFIPSYRKNMEDITYDSSKVEYIKWSKMIDILIDDNNDNISGLEDIGKRGILISQPWNHNRKSITTILDELTKIIEV